MTATTPEDRLIVQGLRLLDGDYPCNPFRLTDLVSTESLTSREQHRVRLMTGLRGGELLENALALDAGLMVSLVLVILARNEKKPNEDLVWNTRLVYTTTDEDASSVDGPALIWLVHSSNVEAEEDDGEPLPPPRTPPPSQSGGTSSSSTSESSENGQSHTGAPASAMSAGYDPEILATSPSRSYTAPTGQPTTDDR